MMFPFPELTPGHDIRVSGADGDSLAHFSDAYLEN
jgi:hypothetical protein